MTLTRMENLNRTFFKTLMRYLLLVFFAQCSCSQTNSLRDITQAYEFLPEPESPCYVRRAALFVDKPAYRPGETVFITAYYYNLLDKKPLTDCDLNSQTRLQITDADDSIIQNINPAPETENSDNINYSTILYTFEVSEDLPGGVYKIKMNQPNEEIIKFFVLQFTSRAIGITADWSTESISVGDIVKGKITIQALTRDFEDFEDVQLNYSITNSDGTVLQQETINLNDNVYQLNFQVPPEFQEFLTVLIEVNADAFLTTYKKEFSEAIYDNIVIDFNAAMGKIVENFNNKFYYQAFDSDSRIFTVGIKDAEIISKVFNRVNIIESNIESNDEGKGTFEIYISNIDVSNQTRYYLRVRYSDEITLEYLIIDLSAAGFSPVGLVVNKLVYETDENILVKIWSSEYRGRIALVLQDKTTIYRNQIHNVNKDSTTIVVPLKSIKLQNAGVLTLQLYTDKSISEEIRIQFNKYDNPFLEWLFENEDFARIFPTIIPPRPRPVPQPENGDYSGQIMQEIDIFVKPPEIIGADIILNDSSYLPGQELEFMVNIDTDCPLCVSKDIVTHAIIMITDESVFLEIEKANQNPSLFTKVFLEKEVHTGSEFRNSHRYIDYLFNSEERSTTENVDEKDERLGLLLGNQGYRKFFFSPKELKEFYNNVYDNKYAQFREDLLYLLPADRFRPIILRREDILFAGPQAEAAEEVFDEAVEEKSEEPATEEDADVTDESELTETDEQVIQEDTIYFNKIDNVKDMEVQTFVLPNLVTNFSIRVFLYNNDGQYGFVKKQLEVRRPFNLSADIPLYILEGENFAINVVVENNKPSPLQVNFKKPETVTMEMDANSTQQLQITLNADNLPFVIEAYDDNEKVLGQLAINTQIVKPGIPVVASQSGVISMAEDSYIELNHTLPTTLITSNSNLEICYVNSFINIILDAIRKINTIPIGCFEQASAIAFPLILALKFLLQLPQTPEIEELIQSIIKNLKEGIRLLLTYETSTGGFEWFGNSPGHATLTAYGLWQFYEISRLNVEENLFDTTLLQRLTDFIKSTRKDDGGFEIRPGLDSLGNPPQEVSDIFIYYVISQQFGDNLSEDDFDISYIDRVYNGSTTNNQNIDSYKLALIGLFFVNINQLDKARTIIDILISRQDQVSGKIQQSETSITRSFGNNLDVETTALTMILALRTDAEAYMDAVNLCVRFLVENLKDGYFGSTQATILSLYAFTLYMEKVSFFSDEPIAFDISINGDLIGDMNINVEDVLGSSQCKSFAQQLVSYEEPDENLSIRVSAQDTSLQTNANYMFSINYNYYALLPDSVASSPLQVSLSKTQSENLRFYTILVRNTENKEQGMVIYNFYKPSCYDFNINDLETMRLRGEIDFYELKDYNSRIVFYMKGIGATQTWRFSLSLNKRFQLNDCEERAHEIYLYYNKQESVVYAIA